MKSKEYILEFTKLVHGLNKDSFLLDDDFLAKIEGAAIQQANVEASLELLKTDNMYDLQFHLEGTVLCECDVCLESFDMPVDADFQLLMKISEFEKYDDDEILYITEKMIEYDLSQYLYESLMLSVPVKKTCDMSGTKECNKEVMAKLEQLRADESGNEDDDDDETNPAWDKLKGIFN